MTSDRDKPDLGLFEKPAHDIPRWLSLLIVIAVSGSLPLALVCYSSDYLKSPDGFADGGDMYSHIVEALHLKEQLQRGETDLWYGGVTLGYPFFLAYQPLPCCVTAAVMALTERYISPFLAFRWLFFLLLTSMPFSWYLGTQQLGMTRLQSCLVTLCLFSMRSWIDFGLELSAFRKYGLYTQAYGMLMLPVAVGSIYRYVIYSRGSRDVVVIVIALNLLSHSIFGIYALLITATMLASLFLARLFLDSTLSPGAACARALDVHTRSLTLCGWWLVPTLYCHQYIGGLFWKYDVTNSHDISIVSRKLLSGEIYDYGRSIPYITLGVLAGLSCVFLGHHQKESTNMTVGMTTRRNIRYIWLGLSFAVSLTLFLGRGTFGAWYDLIPCHEDIDSIRYLNVLHFFGLLLFAVGSSCVVVHICKFASRLTPGVGAYKLAVMVMMFGAPLYLSSQLENIKENLTVSEMSADLQTRLRVLKEYPVLGRMYGSKHFGTAEPWDFAFLPYFTEKPGVHTYSRGFHDTLSVFYLEFLNPDLRTTPAFPDILRLLNIRYIFAKTTFITPEFREKCKLLKLMKLNNDTQLFIRSPDETHGYFEFVRVPGMIQGHLKNIRESVQSITRIYTVNAVLAINPDASKSSMATIKACQKSSYKPSSIFTYIFWLLPMFRPHNSYEISWRFRHLNLTMDVFMENVINSLLWKPVKSSVLKESIKANEYSAIVEIPKESFSKDFYSTEHLLLKVTYHPYWSCRYAPPTILVYTQNERDDIKHTDQEYEKWTEVAVNHVTPNLMSVVLPPGRHEVICSYSNPLYQKFGFLLFLILVTVICTKEILQRAFRFRN